jgi:hypothetical protein
MAGHIEDARQALRHGRPAEAIALLTPLAGDPRLTYAREWATHRSTLSHPELQSVLAWLCADEASRAGRAFEAGEFAAAAELWHEALRLDRRFTAAALGRARAIHAACLASRAGVLASQVGSACVLASQVGSAGVLASRWSDTVSELATAEQLAIRACDDRALAAEANSLLDRIRAERSRAVKLAAYWRCHARLESFGEQHRRARPVTWLDFSTIRTSFAPIAADVERLVRRYGHDDPDIGRLLRDLAGLTETARARLA